MIAVDTNILIYAHRGEVPEHAAALAPPTDGFPLAFRDACEGAGVRGNLAFDAQIAAVCREHGVDRLLTADRDFARFDGLTIEHL